MLHQTRWTLRKIAGRLELIDPLVYRRSHPLPPMRYQKLPTPSAAPPVDPAVSDNEWPIIEPNSYWGEWQTDFIMRTTFQVPRDWETGDKDRPLALYLPLGIAGDFVHPEALAYVDGRPYAGIDRFHQEISLPRQWTKGQPHALALHGWTGLGGLFGADSSTKLRMGTCAVVQIDQPTRDFIAAVRVALGAARELAPDHPALGSLLNGLDRAFMILDTREPFGEQFYDTVPAAHQALREVLERAAPPLDVDIYAAGHAHIDVAWLWTVEQTRRKAGRTFHTVLRYMEQYPEYRFTQSQPQLYDFVRRDYPELFKSIQERVAEGRWEATGGMWVEADCNLTGAESLARQLMLGRSFFREHFGVGTASPVLWLPDVFGYAWNLPQLIHQSNLKYFFTIKIGWSQYNRIPFESFWWQGLDGTRVLTHFSPTPIGGASDGMHSSHTSTYNASATPADALGTWQNFQQRSQSNVLLMAFGHGDGGGGPDREMLENIRELKAFPGMPRVRHATGLEFFQRLEEESGGILPVWKGELYLEYHRGTYTTQSKIKRANRKAEFLLHDTEFLAACAARVEPTYEYPHVALRRAWELCCLNQFHDIIPGSSIGEVYQEALPHYDEVSRIAAQIRNEALAHTARHLGGELLLVNPTSFERHDLVFWPDGDETAGQPVQGGVLLAPEALQPYSLTPHDLARPFVPPDTTLKATTRSLENDYLLVAFNDAGDIVRIYDKQHDREVLPEGYVANQFQAFEDRPLNWDAWDIDIYFDDKRWLADPAESITVVEDGPLRATLKVERTILNSHYVQYISLAYNSPRLDFNTTVDWQERHILLKVAFPVNILTPRATFDIQWGNVERPTHRNTSWDWARFETCAHKWIDVSEGDYGVSLLNDCKYGHDVQDHAPAGTVMRLSLLRSPTVPDPDADRGTHRFTYSLLPHAGDWGRETIAQSYLLNDPTLVYPVENPQPVHAHDRPGTAFVSVDRPNVVIETVKAAEDGAGVIVRLYESQRQRGPCVLRTNFPVSRALRTNLLEDNESDLQVDSAGVHFSIKPYEIITIRLQ